MKDIQKFIEETINKTSLIKSDEIPNIDLYMDQVTTFLTSHLTDNNEDTEPVFTKTMINNYAKVRLFPSPVKKKYTGNHIILLIIIYHLKSVLSISDIASSSSFFWSLLCVSFLKTTLPEYGAHSKNP